ncbi:universal stress protein [Streptomyces sp. NPDC059447]|uniref:universal stress protein n=1 Tax=Streptomyces sp. NPDC059447 TaxID=3346834 RepID=UPI0036BAE9DC
MVVVPRTDPPPTPDPYGLVVLGVNGAGPACGCTPGRPGLVCVRTRAADLLVIGRHRKRALSRHLSPVTHTVPLHTGCPVAVVPLEEDAARAAAA